MKTVTTYQEFKELKKQGLNIFHIKSMNCGVCISIAYQLDKMFETLPIDYYEVYTDQVQELSGQELIFTVPTVVVTYDDKEVLRESRFVDLTKIRSVVNIYTKEMK